jgi:hypothetical protein
MMPKPRAPLTFDADTHRYAVGGKPIPSVTTVLRAAGLIDFSGVPLPVLDPARERGTRVHLATELDDRGELDIGSVIPEELGYLDAYRRFKREAGFIATSIEQRVYSHRYWYAGTLDRIGLMRKKRCLLDIKTGAPQRAVGPQTAAYKAALPMNVMPRFAVYLQPDGSYQLASLNDSDDLAVFLAALRLVTWRKLL